MFGEGVFKYWVQRAGAGTVWVHFFYERVALLVVTLERTDVDAGPDIAECH